MSRDRAIVSKTFRTPLRKTIPDEEGASRYKKVRLPDLTEYRVSDPANEVLPEGARSIG
jgi:hypothetical protein